MNLDAIASVAETLLKKRKAHLHQEVGRIYAHGQRAAKLALFLRNALVPDDASHDEILTVAAWFHDIGKGIEPHPTYGALLTQAALESECTEAELNEICELIRLHWERKSALKPDYDPATHYSKWVLLLQDADSLDHFGTQDIWISFHAAAHYEDSVADNIRWNDEHYLQYVARARAGMNFDLSLRILDERVAFATAFYERFRLEGMGEVIHAERLLSSNGKQRDCS
jgi:uncharacterized protein